MTENKEATDKSGKREMHLRIVSAEKRIFSGSVARVHVKGAIGELGILPGHSPLLTTIPSGNVSYTTPEGERKIVFVSGGVLEVQPLSVTILADTAMRGEDIEESKALEAKREAEAMLANAASDKGYSQALSQLSRAISQLKAVELSRKGRVK
ncbi:F0F1 ATP synthase subunit epsilon [Succinimonas amylolytica]|uniref:F0F1 ATP synthase subunit epsilon n=1 Tax=Succinimonas amylolytica TaxID=83769 RepID=UPI00036FAA89|nr:F0F1 ATP synthase subunit epsilon [Succinimonas amylolytica]